MIWHPLQRGVREDQVDATGFVPATDVANLEGDSVRRSRSRRFDHGVGVVDSEHSSSRDRLREGRRQPSIAAAEVNDATRLRRLQEMHQIPERLFPFSGKLVVGLRIPAFERLHRLQILAHQANRCGLLDVGLTSQ